MTTETPGEQADQAASVLAPEIDFLADPDVAGLGRSLATVLRGAMENPAAVTQAWLRYALQLAEIPPVALSSWMGTAATPPVQLNPKDRRFADRTWSENPAFYSLRMYHQAFAEFVDQLVTAAGLERIQETKARLLTGLMMDALAPTNFLLTNPAALKRAVETGGASLARGAHNFADDLLNNNGRPRQVDTSKFTIGKNLAATPAKVVYRNDLMELLQYSAQTPQVHCSAVRLGSTSTTSWTSPRGEASSSGRSSTSGPYSRSATETLGPTCPGSRWMTISSTGPGRRWK
jgi:polyhydroxyalkanoate synthase